MKNTNAVRTEIHYAQVGEYQLPLLTEGGVMLSQRKLRLLQSPIKKAAPARPPPVKIWASGWQWRAKKFCWWMPTRRAA